MNINQLPLFFFYNWNSVPEELVPSLLAEFRDNGVRRLVFTDVWLLRTIRDPEFFPRLDRYLKAAGMKLGEAHGLCGEAYDLCCCDSARRPGMISDHILAMNYAAEAGAATYTMHVGAGAFVYRGLALPRLRELALDSLEKLAPAARRAGLIIAVENAFEPPNSAAEVMALVNRMATPEVGCCFDSGHAEIMAPFPGKDPRLYRDEVKQAWAEGVMECSDTLEQMYAHLVTCHLHDNDGYGDSHGLPGSGKIDWASLIPRLCSAPRLLTLQTEVVRSPKVSIAAMARKFYELFPTCQP